MIVLFYSSERHGNTLIALTKFIMVSVIHGDKVKKKDSIPSPSSSVKIQIMGGKGVKTNISSVMGFSRWWVLKSKIFAMW